MTFSTTALRRTVTATVVSSALVLGSVITTTAQQKVTLNGAGASFPAPLYERYAREFKQKNPGIQVNYQAIGSGGGIRQTIAGTVDFGGSDAAMTDAELAKVGRGVILVPTAGGAVAVVYNLPGVSNLKLSRTALPEIFAGRITKWNDPKIAAANPGVNLPNSPIRPVVRADSSGTTFIFTNHLSNISSYFNGRIGTSKSPNWTIKAIKSPKNAGVAASVKRTPGSIGYVEYGYAKENNLGTALVQNRTGQYIAPSNEAADKALETVTFPSNYRVFVGDPTDGYPIVGLTWMMVYKNGYGAKADAMKKWISYVLTEGQRINSSLTYTRIPSNIAQKVINEVNSTIK